MKKLLVFMFYIICFSLFFGANAAYCVKGLLLPVPESEITAPIMVNFSKIEEDNFPPEYRKVSRYKISAINPTGGSNPAGAYFPGFRGADQLIIYQPGYGKYTYTNEYGKEATVRNGRVISFSGANSYIPVDGFVISGHGKAKKWINKNLIEGAYVKINPESMTIESVITPRSYLYKVDRGIDEVKKVIINYKRSLPGYEYKSAQKYYDASREKFEKAKLCISEGKYKKALRHISSALLLSEEAFYNAVPGVRDEFHGIWVRPVEKNRSEIVETLDEMKKTGIENIFLETYYQGYTIFPSKTMEKYGLSMQRQEFKGWDPLKHWIKEAHKRDMKIHVWFQAFYTGNDVVSETPGHVLFVYPEWANVQRKNALKNLPQPSKSEHNGYFLDPANHMVRRFLLELISEISTNYEIDGLNIDYVRYPKSLSYNFPGYLDSTWGYTKYAREEFRKNYGKDPLDLDVNHALWQKWIRYRQDKVNEFVSGLKSAAQHKNITISAVIFPDIEKTSITKLQNWRSWANNNYVDAFTPLIMSSDQYRAGKTVREIRGIAGNKVTILPGLFEPFTLGKPKNLLHQIMTLRKTGTPGFVIFDKAHLNKDFANALRARALRN